TKPPLLRRCGRAPPPGETPHRFALAQAPYPPAVAAPPPRPGEFELDTSYIRLRAVRVLHPARHPPERPRVGSWPSDVKAGAVRERRPVVEGCGRTPGTARRRLGLRKRETVSARSRICQWPCVEPKKHSRSIGGRRSRFRRHLWRSAGRRGCLTVHSAQSGNG